ncbi:pilus assembly PilX family protein [Granulosicoccus sp. 3-233]|uniref:pilus assembly PilX family protein n=1 Tax=Granulosicoccus sp. 3-233 TaxID=3417969 RepID=UPI003D34D50F
MNHRAARQQGSVLMVTMIMIFMLSILGVSAMRGASLEGQLASNAIHKEVTFQAAESASDAVLAINGKLESIICNDTDETLSQNNLGQSAQQVTEAVLEYGGRAAAMGYSLGGPVSARRFVVTGTSSLPDVHTSTTIAQGMLLIGAADDSGDC